MQAIVALVLALLLLHCRTSNALLDNGFNVTKPLWLFNGSLKPGTAEQLPPACVAAYTAPIDCNATILMSPNLAEKHGTLEEACNPECATSLLAFERGVREACRGVNLTTSDPETPWLGAVVAGEAAILIYWKQCLRDL